jgi:hypothetical protein
MPSVRRLLCLRAAASAKGHHLRISHDVLSSTLMCRFFDRLNLCQLLWLINQNGTQIALYFIVMALHLLGKRPYVVDKIFFNEFGCFTATLSQAQLYALVNPVAFFYQARVFLHCPTASRAIPVPRAATQTAKVSTRHCLSYVTDVRFSQSAQLCTPSSNHSHLLL